MKPEYPQNWVTRKDNCIKMPRHYVGICLYGNQEFVEVVGASPVREVPGRDTNSLIQAQILGLVTPPI